MDRLSEVRAVLQQAAVVMEEVLDEPSRGYLDSVRGRLGALSDKLRHAAEKLKEGSHEE